MAYNIQGGVSDIIIPETINPLDPVKRSLGQKQYELSNHLGNVLVTISDRKLVEEDEGVIALKYEADVLLASDYYPFGMQMPGRQFSAEEYRYGFQGQETDKEWLGGAVSYKYRVHDARIGRFLSVDPLAPDYPHNSPYAFSENRVIDSVELEGLESVYFVNRKKEVDISLMTEAEVENLFYENGVHFDPSWLSGRERAEYWTVEKRQDTYGDSHGTYIRKYGLQGSYQKGGEPFEKDVKRSFLEWGTSWDVEFSKRDGYVDAAGVVVAFWGVILSGGTLLAAEGLAATALAGGGLVIAVDDLTQSPEGTTFFEDFLEDVGGKELMGLYKGAKVAMSIKNAAKGMANITVELSNGNIINGTYDMINDVYEMAGAVNNVNTLVEAE
ncbi:MAG: RHS repeat-associated protein [Roseivirga sp.]